MRTKALTSRQLAQQAAKFADDKKAQDVMILDMRGLVNFCDYFVIGTGTSGRHVKSIAEGINEGLAKLGTKAHPARNLKGFGTSQDPAEGAWVLLDMGDVVVHVFEPQTREFYGLEHLWQDAPKVKFTKS
ncbi:MAG: ribosome silencing factor [Candidatus Omnitrophica bacterium]|nr:ribosome silencing factor [Candidatus Omnitrophota bacterium]